MFPHAVTNTAGVMEQRNTVLCFLFQDRVVQMFADVRRIAWFCRSDTQSHTFIIGIFRQY